jgi:SAM-dependent methyltransferase
VHGIDASPAMVERLRLQPGGADIPVTLGSFADMPVQGEFSLIYVVFNTFYALTSQDEQVRCFAGAARCLAPGGVFLIEAFFPDLARYQGGQTLRVVELGLDQARLDAATLDPIKQIITSQHIVLSEAGLQMYPVQIRYCFPAELDLMARLAGLRLRERWGSWRSEGLTSRSERVISIYEKAG